MLYNTCYVAYIIYTPHLSSLQEASKRPFYKDLLAFLFFSFKIRLLELRKITIMRNLGSTPKL